jgi:hypothetical protein
VECRLPGKNVGQKLVSIQSLLKTCEEWPKGRVLQVIGILERKMRHCPKLSRFDTKNLVINTNSNITAITAVIAII